LDISHLERLLEALLFVADGPVAIDTLAELLSVDAETIATALEGLARSLASRGVRVERDRMRVLMVSAPEAAPYVERLLGLDTTARLSSAALETLAIIAYRKPVTRAQVEAIRGVNSDAVVRTLLAKSLIEPVGRLDQAGRPVLYGTTFEFLQYFGIRSPDDLPPIPDPDSESPATAPLADSLAR
jgi:segregation and condensation protein B